MGLDHRDDPPAQRAGVADHACLTIGFAMETERQPADSSGRRIAHVASHVKGYDILLG